MRMDWINPVLWPNGVGSARLGSARRGNGLPPSPRGRGMGLGEGNDLLWENCGVANARSEREGKVALASADPVSTAWGTGKSTVVLDFIRSRGEGTRGECGRVLDLAGFTRENLSGSALNNQRQRNNRKATPLLRGRGRQNRGSSSQVPFHQV